MASTYSLTEILSSRQGVLSIGTVRAVVMTESAFVLLQRVIHENMPELVRYGFYEMGYRAGMDLGETHDIGTVEDRFRYFVETYRQAGYGDIDVVTLDFAGPYAVLRGRSLLEVGAARASAIYRTPRAVDHYSRGMFAGLFSRLLGKEVICEEVACEYRGDPACEFRVMAYAATPA